MESILRYLKAAYDPLAIIAYGSFADGSNNQSSDFDALVIIPEGQASHDNTVIDGTELDVFIYPRTCFAGDYDPEDYIQVWDGNILLDREGLAAGLQARVRAHLAAQAPKSPEENQTNVAWCEKMLRRTERGDPEGFFRWHWLLVDSLEIYCDLRGQRYFGPKKSLRRMAQEDPASARLYQAALSALDREALAAWVARLRALLDP